MRLYGRSLPKLHFNVAVVFSMLFATCAIAQAPTGTIEGTVADRSGLTVTTAQVILVDAATAVRRELQVGADGRFQFAALPVGDYSLRIESKGFAQFVEEPIHLSVGGAVRVDAALSPASVQATIVVQSGAENIDL